MRDSQESYVILNSTLMKYGDNHIYLIIDLYNYYLSSEYSFEGEIELVPNGYCTIEGKFHRWNISPIYIGSQKISCIKLSDTSLGEILDALNSTSIDQSLKLNKEIIKNSLK